MARLLFRDGDEKSVEIPATIVSDGLDSHSKAVPLKLTVSLDDLVPGVQMGRPGYTQSFIFAENARTLTW